MIQIIAGEKGQGKTKRLISMANEEIKVCDGHLVYIDDDNRHMYDLQRDIRFVETSPYKFDSYKVFFGFICGIESQDTDIEKIYIDGITNIVEGIGHEHIVKFIGLLEQFSETNKVDFIMTINGSNFPEPVSKYCI